MKKKIILIDMDGTIADFDESILKKVKKKYSIDLKKEDIKHFRIEKSFPEEYRTEIVNMIYSENFYLELKPIPDTIKYIKEIFNHKDIDAFFCTSPLLSKYCIPEKQQWIQKYFGEEYLKKIIFTKDKTVIFGDILIDDKPTIEGVNKNPNWEHIFFDQPYNQNIKKRRINSWKDWEKIILK